jgi:ubiquinone/menaquinone biosynthesis C-methylase UbiE
MPVDYSQVTEVPGGKASGEQLQRLFSRYHFAGHYCKNKDVLEVACGSGQGLGYIARTARSITGGDFTQNLVQIAQRHYRGRIALLCLDAHHLPFEAQSFDVVIFFEAIYYLTRPEEFLDECSRVLRDNGTLLVCTVNKDWSDFNPSPHSVKYFSAPELFQLLRQKFVSVELYGGFAVSFNSVADRITSAIKRLAVAFNLIPRTMAGKELLKGIFFGKLVSLPYELYEDICEYSPLVPIPFDSPNTQHKVLYAVARAAGA